MPIVDTVSFACVFFQIEEQILIEVQLPPAATHGVKRIAPIIKQRLAGSPSAATSFLEQRAEIDAVDRAIARQLGACQGAECGKEIH